MVVVEHIDPESADIREVFAHFGLAMYHAQCLEKQLVITLATKYGPGPTRITRTEFDSILEELDSKTLGQLVSKIKNLKSLSDEEGKLLKGALETRNWLAHRYFWERATDFLSESGRASMNSELQNASSLLETQDELFTKKTLEWAESHGINGQLIDKELERLVREK